MVPRRPAIVPAAWWASRSRGFSIQRPAECRMRRRLPADPADVSPRASRHSVAPELGRRTSTELPRSTNARGGHSTGHARRRRPAQGAGPPGKTWADREHRQRDSGLTNPGSEMSLPLLSVTRTKQSAGAKGRRTREAGGPGRCGGHAGRRDAAPGPWGGRSGTEGEQC